MATSKAKKKQRTPAAPVALPPTCPALLSRAQIAAAIGVSLRTLDGMLSKGEFPPHDGHLGAFRRWRPDTLAAWIDERFPKR